MILKLILFFVYFQIGFTYTFVYYVTRFATVKLTKRAWKDCFIVGLIWPLIILDYNIKQFKNRKGLLK